MTKRRLLIIALALVAIVVAVPVVPWAIVEWHVREIAADRQALLDALEAPEGSWEWQAVEQYAESTKGAEKLRYEFAWLLLWYRFGLSREPTSERLLRVFGDDLQDWEACVLVEGKVHWISWSPHSVGANRLKLHQRELRILELAQSNGRAQPPAATNRERWLVTVKRLGGIVTASSEPLATSTNSSIWVLRLGDPMIPPEARVEGFDDPDTLVVFAKLREPGGDLAAAAPDSEETDSSP